MTAIGLFLLGLLVFLWAATGLFNQTIPGADFAAHLVGLVCGLCLLLGSWGMPLPSFRRSE